MAVLLDEEDFKMYGENKTIRKYELGLMEFSLIRLYRPPLNICGKTEYFTFTNNHL